VVGLHSLRLTVGYFLMEKDSLLAGVRDGNDAAIQQLVVQFQKRVFNVILNLVQSREDAEELCQDVFIEIIQSAARFREESSLSTWIYRIAYNRSLDFIKMKKRKKRFAFLSSLWNQENQLTNDVSDFVHPGIILERKEEAAFFFKALNQLPESQKTVFVLAKLEGLPLREISEIMKISESAVESMLGRAKQSLRKILGNYYQR
jgi:RNA polymerase sigma factor (sigma-70 family)